MRPYAILCLAAAALLLASVPAAAAPYATFEYRGTTYAVSEAYQEGDWYASCDFCANTGAGWRLPTLAEAIAMRDRYQGNDPLDIGGWPAWCVSGIKTLWTSSACAGGAIFVHPTYQTIIDDEAPCLQCEHENEPDGDWCCLWKTGYWGAHLCPMARCVRPLGGATTPLIWLPIVRKRR
jgi:hypothetical protein